MPGTIKNLRFGRILCVETVRDLDEGEELFVKYDITVDGDGLKSALKTALSLGQIFSGKSRREFAKEVKPYLKVLTYQIFKKPFLSCILIYLASSCRFQKTLVNGKPFLSQMVSDVVKKVKMKDLIKFS